MKKLFLAIILLIVIVGCDDGISPGTAEQTGFSGKVTFLGEWPDSITRTHLVVFDSLLEQANDFSALNLKYVSLEIPYSSSEFIFNTSKDSSFLPPSGNLESGTYNYVAVVQSTTPALSLDRKDWTVAGIYYKNGDTVNPGTLIIPENTLVENINIICDFNNPPPQPPGGE